MASTDPFTAASRRLRDAAAAVVNLPSQSAPEAAAAWREYGEARMAMHLLIQNTDRQTHAAYDTLPK